MQQKSTKKIHARTHAQTHARKKGTHICRLLHPSLCIRPTPAGRYLLPGLMNAQVSDYEKYVSDFTLPSPGLVH